MGSKGDIFKIKEEIGDVAIVKMELDQPDYSDVTTNFYEENDHNRCENKKDVKQEWEGHDLKATSGMHLENKNEIDITLVKTEKVDIIMDKNDELLCKTEQFDSSDANNVDIILNSVAWNPKVPQKENTQSKCPICDYTTSDTNQFVRHLKINPTRKTYSCSGCSQAFCKENALFNHILRYHSSDDLIASVSTEIFECGNCPYKTTMKCVLARHMRKHFRKSVLPLKCPECEYVTKKKDLLYRHSKKHSRSKQFACSDCDQSFVRKANLRDHVLHVHSDSSNVALINSACTVHICPYCTHKTTIRSNWSRHLLTHTKDEFVTFNPEFVRNNQEVKYHVCPCCTKQFLRKENLNEHILRHHDDSSNPDLIRSISCRLFECSYCPYKTTLKSNLSRHLPKHKTDNSTIYKCSECKYESLRQDHLRRHIRLHKVVETMFCSGCSKPFKRKETLFEHILRQHKEDQDLIASISCDVNECAYCSYKTTVKSKLSRHLVVHSKDYVFNAYKCDECDFRTYHKYNLQRHRQNHLKKSNGKQGSRKSPRKKSS